MRTILNAALACAALAVTGAFGAEKDSACQGGSDARGMHARMEAIKRETDRIEWTVDRAEQRRLMELQMKHVRESLRELRRREVPAECRAEMMNVLLESMVRHEQVMHDVAGH